MMPFELELPQPGFLDGVKQLCHERGAVLIFDEVRSGFRMARGGAQEYFGVTPDLAAVSKAMANGYALAAVVGRREVMRAAEVGLFSATFFVSALEMAATIATLRIVERDGVIEQLWTRGETFQAGLRDLVAQSGLEVEVVGVAPMPFLRFQMANQADNERARTEFYAEAARLGVYFHPGHHWFVNFSHSAEDVERTLEVCQDAFRAAENAVL
jgi:glutamate-1-semialdehyde aminotransferase